MFNKKKKPSYQYVVIILGEGGNQSIKFFDEEIEAGNYIIKNNLEEKAMLYERAKIKVCINSYYE